MVGYFFFPLIKAGCQAIKLLSWLCNILFHILPSTIWEKQSARTSGFWQIGSKQSASRQQHAADCAHERLLLNPIGVTGRDFPDFIRLGKGTNILLESSVPTETMYISFHVQRWATAWTVMWGVSGGSE